jgi:hypothetical protein
MPKFTVPSTLQVRSTGALAVAVLAVTAAITVGPAGTASAAPIAPVPTCGGVYAEAAPGYSSLGVTVEHCGTPVNHNPPPPPPPQQWRWSMEAIMGPAWDSRTVEYGGAWFWIPPHLPPGAFLAESFGRVCWVLPW